MLFSAVVGPDMRATMDIDTTVRSLEVSKEKTVKILKRLSIRDELEKTAAGLMRKYWNS